MINVAKILIIAGSDSCGGAGIQADIKTSTAHKIFCSTALTSITAQNTQKVYEILDLPSDFIRKQIEVVFDDITFDAIKIGMLSNAEIIETVASCLAKKYKKIPIVLDPVMVATSGDLLLESAAIETLKKKLIPKAKLITPNVDEAEVLSSMRIKNLGDMRLAAKQIKSLGCEAVLIKGGHLNFADKKIHSLLLDSEGDFHFISNKKIAVKKVHGTGCSLASAITCNLAKKLELLPAIKKANDYVYRSLADNIKAGKGSLCLRHW